MPTKQDFVYSLRLLNEHMAKLRIIAKENGRSVNKEIEILVKNHIKAYETENGEIITSED